MSIHLDQIAKAFGAAAAVAGVSETIDDGSLVALLGPSGCGKTTLLRIIAGLEYPDAGRVLFDGVDVTNVSLRERNVGFVFQSYALFPHLDVAANVGFGLAVRGKKRAAIDKRVEELLGLVRLDGYARRKPHQLSGGQRQRVALARALAAEPRILLLDEPFAALDLQVRKDLRRWLRELHDRTHVTTLIVTHDAEEAMEIADRIVLMRDGRVLQTGAPHALYREPADPFVMRFFGAVNEIDDAAGRSVFVRPHDFDVARHPFDGSLAAIVDRVTDLGPVTRLECRLDDGRRLDVEMHDERAHALLVAVGSTVYVAPQRTRPSATALSA